MKLVIGLGNPGKRYQGTRHNIGFEVIDGLAARHGGLPYRERFQAQIVEVSCGGVKVMLLRPMTFMNLSGQSVIEARDFFKVEADDILVVCDDFQLPLGRLRFRAKGSSGGQKGLADIILRLGGEAIPRLRIGIGGPPPGWDPADYVLGKFTESERKGALDATIRGMQGVEDWIARGMAYCMNAYNADEKDKGKEAGNGK